MTNKIKFSFFCFIITTFCFGQSKLEIPQTNEIEKVISHVGYSLVYSEQHEQAKWVAYELTKSETNKLFERTNKFIQDPLVKSQTANNDDYSGSGYDRGHLAPASDMGWSQTAMKESFYYSNISPQLAGFNRGIWKRLEELMRSWAKEYGSIYIITGPILEDNLKRIGFNGVSVPKYYYKVILAGDKSKGIGFIMEGQPSKSNLSSFAVTIDKVEDISKIDFFPNLNDEIEEKIESEICLNCWSWEINNQNSRTVNSTTSQSAQCKGITQNGIRCKNNTKNLNEYCYLHENQKETSKPQISPQKRTSSVQCSGITKAGSRCKRKTLSTNEKCYQHGGN